MTTVAQEGIASLEVLLPPAIEQQQIVDHLDRGIGQIVAVVAKAQDSIALLREHRTALISAAVTGKIDVREVQ
jgi:type I restriction enzyme S subunit